jgi:hypothetical protein
MKCSKCESDNLEVDCVKEFQGCEGHVGFVMIPTHYYCIDCGHEEDL